MIDRHTVLSVDVPQSQTVNPYWDIVRTIPGNAIDWKYDHRWSPDWTAMMVNGEYQYDRQALCIEYSWAIPDPIALQFVAEHLAPRAVEIGAGAGYWAWQLSQLGVDIVAYDAAPPHLVADNHWHSPRTDRDGSLTGETRSVFFDVQHARQEVLTSHADRTLFLCWPPYSDDMATLCLNAYTGNKLVYIGEGEGGCTGDDSFFETLTAHWTEIAEHRPVQWWGIHDIITVYERKEVLV